MTFSIDWSYDINNARVIWARTGYEYFKEDEDEIEDYLQDTYDLESFHFILEELAVRRQRLGIHQLHTSFEFEYCDTCAY